MSQGTYHSGSEVLEQVARHHGIVRDDGSVNFSELARRLGVPQATVSRAVRGVAPRSDLPPEVARQRWRLSSGIVSALCREFGLSWESATGAAPLPWEDPEPSTEAPLTRPERELLEVYRELPTEGRENVREFAEALRVVARRRQEALERPAGGEAMILVHRDVARALEALARRAGLTHADGRPNYSGLSRRTGVPITALARVHRTNVPAQHRPSAEQLGRVVQGLAEAFGVTWAQAAGQESLPPDPSPGRGAA